MNNQSNERLKQDVDIALRLVKESVEFEMTLSQPDLRKHICQLQGMTFLLVHHDLYESKQKVQNYIEELFELYREIESAI